VGRDREKSDTGVRRIKSVIRTIPFDVNGIELIAETLGEVATLAPFQLPGGKVFQLTVHDQAGLPATMVSLWPTIRRVDAVSPSSTIVFTDVQSVDLVGEIEVQFRRRNREYLIVVRGGKVIVRA
jgi:hypothetical protein